MNGVVGVMMDHRIFELMGGSNDMFNINPKVFASGVSKTLLKKWPMINLMNDHVKE